MSKYLLKHSVCILPVLAMKHHASECEYPKHKIIYKKKSVPGWTYLDTNIDDELKRVVHQISAGSSTKRKR